MVGVARVNRTYGLVAAKFDEGIKKRTNPGKAEGHSGILRISCDEDFNMTLEGLDDGKYHFLEVRIQKIRLLLEVVDLHTEGRAGTLSELDRSCRVRSHSLSTPYNAVATTLIWSPRQTDPDSGRAKE